MSYSGQSSPEQRLTHTGVGTNCAGLAVFLWGQQGTLSSYALLSNEEVLLSFFNRRVIRNEGDKLGQCELIVQRRFNTRITSFTQSKLNLRFHLRYLLSLSSY